MEVLNKQSPFMAEVKLPDQLIKNIVLAEIENVKLQPLYLDFNETAERSGLKQKRLRETLKYFREELDSKNDGCVYYPVQGQAYKIDYFNFCKFCRKHTNAIWNLQIPG